ncbi:MAG: LptF/LptG family permease, partial [Bacteroidota bacterium]
MILFRYILRNHAGPFIFSLLTLIFIFLFNFLTKFADRLVGKGLGFWIITKLIAYNLAWMVVLVVPMSILVATLMAYGNMSHNNEIAIMKASGVSVYKMIMPPFILSIIIGFLLVEFNNKIYPDANHAARILIQDISNKKPTLSL